MKLSTEAIDKIMDLVMYTIEGGDSYSHLYGLDELSAKIEKLNLTFKKNDSSQSELDVEE